MRITPAILVAALTLAAALNLHHAASHPTVPRTRVSRFLSGDTSALRVPSGATCRSNGQACPGTSATCCNQRCVDVESDRNNCGACGRVCGHSLQCCGGECVSLLFDQGHCGRCHKQCSAGGRCIQGLCDYA